MLGNLIGETQKYPKVESSEQNEEETMSTFWKIGIGVILTSIVLFIAAYLYLRAAVAFFRAITWPYWVLPQRWRWKLFVRKDLQACIDECEPTSEETDGEDEFVFEVDCTKMCMEFFDEIGAYRFSVVFVLALTLMLLLGKFLGRVPIPWFGVLAIPFLYVTLPLFIFLAASILSLSAFGGAWLGGKIGRVGRGLFSGLWESLRML